MTAAQDFLAGIDAASRQGGVASGRRSAAPPRRAGRDETGRPAGAILVGTPKGRLNRLERDLLGEPWQEARPGVQVKLLPKEGELYVFAQSLDRVAKERGMRRRQLKGLWARLKDLHRMSVNLSRDELLIKPGQAKAKAPAGWRLARRRGRAGACAFRSSRSQEVRRASPRRALSPSQQSYRRRPGDALGLLPPARPNRGSVSNPQRRPRRRRSIINAVRIERTSSPPFRRPFACTSPPAAAEKRWRPA